MTKKKNPYIGSTFESFLKEEGIYEEVTAATMKRVLAWQIAQAMKKRRDEINAGQAHAPQPR